MPCGYGRDGKGGRTWDPLHTGRTKISKGEEKVLADGDHSSKGLGWDWQKGDRSSSVQQPVGQCIIQPACQITGTANS